MISFESDPQMATSEVIKFVQVWTGIMEGARLEWGSQAKG